MRKVLLDTTAYVDLERLPSSFTNLGQSIPCAMLPLMRYSMGNPI